MTSIRSQDTWVDFDKGFYETFTALKKRGKKVMLGLGGWSDSEGDKYSRMVNDDEKREIFINQAVDYLIEHNFDGLELDWEFPVCWQMDCSKGPASDRQGFSTLIKELGEKIHDKN